MDPTFLGFESIPRTFVLVILMPATWAWGLSKHFSVNYFAEVCNNPVGKQGLDEEIKDELLIQDWAINQLQG